MRARTVITSLTMVAALGGLTVWAFWPEPVQVDLAVAEIAPMQVTVAAEGVTRIRDPYQVTAPVGGTASRSPVEVGDAVTEGDTVVAVIQPAEPAFLDARARLQAEAAVVEAEAGLRLAQSNVTQAEADLAHAEAELARNQALAARGIIPQRMLDDMQMARDTSQSALTAAQLTVDLQRATLMRVQAQLLPPEAAMAGALDACCVELRAPLSGVVLAVENQSARLVQAGTPLLTIGDLHDLEIEVDLLSADAVRVSAGAQALIERWGGAGTISAQVRRIDPSAFTKVSALGIEEQRVRLRLDILSPAADRPGLGDNYRVFVRIVLWEGAEVLQVPISALFRKDGGWAVFRAVKGRAVLTPVEIGHQNTLEVQILGGLSADDQVVAFPGNKVDDGARLVARVAN
jgi:HlyD family secretion protein